MYPTDLPELSPRGTGRGCAVEHCGEMSSVYAFPHSDGSCSGPAACRTVPARVHRGRRDDQVQGPGRERGDDPGPPPDRGEGDAQQSVPGFLMFLFFGQVPPLLATVS